MSLTFEQVADALRSSQWTYAKTMPQWPHEYTLRKNWDQPIAWEAVVQFIYDNGYREKFLPTGSVFKRIDIDDRKYWPIGTPPESTILINRALFSDDTEFSERLD